MAYLKRFLRKSLYLQAVAMPLVIVMASSCSGRRVREEAEPQPKPSAAEMQTESNVTPETRVYAEAKKNRDVAESNSKAMAEYHFSLAQAYVAEGNPDRAIEEYKLTLMFDPSSPLVHARLAAEYIKKGMLAEAMESSKEALQRDPEFIDARLMLAGLYSASRDNDAALLEYERVLQQDPKHEEAAVYKAQALMEDGRATEALAVLRGFVQKNQESAIAHYYLGRAEQLTGNFEKAVHAFEKAMELRPGFSQAGLALGFLYEEKGKNAQAVAVYKELYETSQDEGAASRAATLLLKDEKYEEAVGYLESLEASDPDDLNVRVKLGLVRMQLRRYEAAIGTFRSILEKSPESDRVRYYLGSVYEELKQNAKAREEFAKIAPNSKLYSDAVLHIAQLHKQDKQLGEAKKVVENAIEKSPETSSFYLFQASLEEETKNIGQAISILEDAVEKFGQDERVRYYLGSLYDRQGDSERGIEQMEAILKVNPDNVDALNYIGYTWTLKGVRLNDAEKLLRRALALKPDNGYIQDSWGWHLYIRGRLREAVVELEKAARLKPDEPTILEHLGDAYLRSNLREKALSQYSDAIQHIEDDEMRKKIEKKMHNLRRELVQTENAGVTERSPASTVSPTK